MQQTWKMVANLAPALALTLALAALPGAAHADGFSTPPGMRCEDAVVVRYHAGPRWSEVEREIGDHLEFMRAQMRAGRILFAGPLYESGGLEIHRGSDLSAVAALVRTDPLVARDVVTISLERFWMCRPAGR